jgi:hypothetical protein
MKLLVMLSSPATCHLLRLRSKDFHHPVFKHPRATDNIIIFNDLFLCIIPTNVDSEYVRFVVQGDYKWCERLHKFINKKIVATQKLNARHCKEQLKKVYHSW